MALFKVTSDPFIKVSSDWNVVLKELQNLDPYKSARLDNLDPLFLKLSAEIVATPITSLFSTSFVSSEIPKGWKAAAIIHLFKGGF